MKNKPIAAPALALALLALSGCAKSPDDNGGPTAPQALNRMTVRMTLQRNVNPLYYYDFAFDEDGNRGTGPVPIVGATTLENGVVGGSFSTLIQFHANQFIAYRRERVGDGEILTRVPNAFVTAPVIPNGNEIVFTLNLDATYTPTGSATPVRLFGGTSGRLPTSLDVNFITSSGQQRDPNDPNSRSYDAFFAFGSGSYLTLSSLNSQTIDNASTVREPANDVFRGTDARLISPEQIDITNFSINILRSSS